MDERFLPAQAAIVANNAEELQRLVRADPSLATDRSMSPCDHPTLLCCLVLEMPPRKALRQLVHLFAECGADLSGPLGAAACIDNVSAVETLLDLGAPIEGKGEDWSPLDEALYWGHSSTVDLLLKRGAQVDNLRKHAALGDKQGLLKCFDAQGNLTTKAGRLASPFGGIPEEVRNDRRQIINNAFVYAAAWGQIETAGELLSHGAEVNAIPLGFDFAGTPLHYAALNNRREMVEWLLERGADSSIRDTKVQNTPDGWADFAKHTELASYLRNRQSQNI